MLHPAIGLLELDSIARGIVVGDAMVKRAPVAVLFAGTIHPGRYVDLVGGAVADVDEAMMAGREVAHPALVDELFLPDVAPSVVAALAGGEVAPGGEALGVVETTTVASLIGAADRGVKGADVVIERIRLADGLGGKAFVLFSGAVGDVEAAVEAATAGLARPELLVERVVISRLHDEMRASLVAGSRLAPHLSQSNEGG